MSQENVAIRNQAVRNFFAAFAGFVALLIETGPDDRAVADRPDPDATSLDPIPSRPRATFVNGTATSSPASTSSSAPILKDSQLLANVVRGVCSGAVEQKQLLMLETLAGRPGHDHFR